jgi:tetratricopeptide (TPR) repeat protein
MRVTGVLLRAVLVGGLELGCTSTGARRAAHTPSHTPATAQPGTARTAATERIAAFLKTGGALLQARRLAEAEAPLRQAVAEARQLGEPAMVAITLTKLANCLVQLQQTTEARASINEALALWTPGSLESDGLVFDLQMTLAESYRYDQRPELSVEPFRAALQTASRHEPEMASKEIDCTQRLSGVLRNLDRDREAAPLLEHALELASRAAQPPSTATSIGTELLVIYAKLGQRAQADALFARFHGVARQLEPDVGTFSDSTLAEVLAYLAPTRPPLAAPAATPASAAPSLGHVSNAAEVVGAMRSDFGTCYRVALSADPQAQGSLRVTMQVGADGRVTHVKAAALSLDVSTVDCVLRRAGSARFSPPEGGNGQIAVPLTFVTSPPAD